MNEPTERPILEVRARESDIGGRYRAALEPYRVLLEDLIDLCSEALDDLPETDPDSQHAVALILARLATESLAVFHLLECGYPVQAFTVVGTMLELTHTAAYIGGDETRAREYFEHANRAKAYPGSIKKTIDTVGKERGLPEEAVAREYETFYNQMCLVKHGNPMAMGLGTVTDEDSLYLFIGPVFTSDTVRLAFATTQQSIRYLLLALTVFARHHRTEQPGTWFKRLTAASDRSAELNAHAGEALAQLSAAET